MTTNPYGAWLGKQETSYDDLPCVLVKRIAATMGVSAPDNGDPLPHLWHWAFFQEPVIEDLTGPDGHPALGQFMPPVDGRNRMWAGGRLSFLSPLLVGQPAERRSEVKNIVEKQGKSGSLVFVTVSHQYWQNGTLCIDEEQDIVYRAPSAPRLSAEGAIPELNWQESVQPSSVMLFRYSAVTFNSHRIHYDYPYVTDTEGYPNLVVHGPLIATMLLHSFIRNNPQKEPKKFEFRGVRPLIQGTRFNLGGFTHSTNQYDLLAFNQDGPAHQARVTF
ncbi:MaoC family dehydratase N-terminal domain-containing protein [Marinobacter sp.]|uniref:FAS1-like dehydratase domain-containing protein n=1 Tax=Marinobacter sp. TaxID=50741 RepID=UPI00356A4F95